MRKQEYAGAGATAVISMNEDSNQKPLMFSGHMDTVYQKGAFGYPPVRVEGDMIYGPGVSDCKGGIIVALLAIAAALCFYLPKNQSGALTVVIDISGQEVRRVPLSDFTEATVTSRGYTLHIAAEGGAVSVTDSDCPTQDCVHTGAISRAGQSIVCLPAQVVVHLEGASAPDAPDVIVG